MAWECSHAFEESTPSESVEKIVTGEVGLESIPVDLTEQILGRKHDNSIIEGSNISQTAFPPVEKGSRWKMPLTVLTVMGLLGLGAWSVYLWQFRQDAGGTPLDHQKESAAEPAEAPEKPGTPEPPAGQKPSVRIEIVGLTEGLDIFIDGAPVESNPFTLEKSEKAVSIEVKRGEEEIFSKSIVPSQDRTLEVEAPLAKPEKAAKKKKAGKGSKKESDEGKAEETKKPKPPPEKIFKDLDV